MAEKKTKAKNTGNVGVKQSTLVWRQYRKSTGAMIGLGIFIMLIVITVVSSFIWDYDTDIVGMNTSARLIAPCLEHPFGTDYMGRSILARVCYGTRYSLLIGLGAVAISSIFGITLGAIAGYFGGKVEATIMWFVELFLMVPNMLLTIVLVAVAGISLTNLIIAFGIATIPHFARNTRAAVMTVCGNEYVEAARAIGVSHWTIIATHIIPNALSPILVQATTRIGGCIVSSAGFSFLGLGVPAPTPEWGAMLSDAKPYMVEHPHLILFPGLAIFVTALAINLIGDGLRDALDPKLKR